MHRQASFARRGPAIDQSLIDLLIRWGPALVALLVFAAEVGVPTGVPVELSLMLVGAYAIDSPLELVFAIVLVLVADVLGATTLFWVSATGGTRVIRFLMRNKEKQEPTIFVTWRERLRGRDVLAVFVGRSLPLVRKPVTIGAGLLRIPRRDFVLGAIPAALIWSGLPLLGGFLIGERVKSFTEEYTRVSQYLVVLSPAIGLLAAAGWWISRGASWQSRATRGRAVAGFVVATIATAIVVYFGWRNQQSREEGAVPLPEPLLQFWLVILGLLLLAVVTVAIVDLRAASRLDAQQGDGTAMTPFDARLTVAWAGLVVAVAAIVVTLQLRFDVIQVS